MTDLQNYVIAKFCGGIQIIPKSWINDDVTKVRWPLFLSQKQFDKAVEEMEEWQKSWPTFPLKGIIGSTSSYEEARQKMRDAEIFLDVPTDSERDEILKQSRKTRAKYVRSSDEDTESEDEQVENVPQFSKPGRSFTKNIETNEKKKDIIGPTEYYEIIDKLSSLNLQVTDLIGGQKKILEKFECISEQINRQPQSPEEVETIDIWYKLPLKNEVALQELEHKLNEDDKYRKKLVKELANIGNRDMKYLASAIMLHTFTNELAIHYSWAGTKEKKAFRDLMICKVILAALKKHYPNFTEKEISRPIKTWFNNASARSDARKLR